jgi:hypothetical protein
VAQAAAEAAGMYATGYHFAVPNVSGGPSQADYAVQNGDYTANGHTLPLALDIEYNPVRRRMLRDVRRADGVMAGRIRRGGAATDRAGADHLQHG